MLVRIGRFQIIDFLICYFVYHRSLLVCPIECAHYHRLIIILLLLSLYCFVRFIYSLNMELVHTSVIPSLFNSIMTILPFLGTYRWLSRWYD